MTYVIHFREILDFQSLIEFEYAQLNPGNMTIYFQINSTRQADYK